MKKIEELLDTQNYLLSCIVKELACICEGSNIGRQVAGCIADEMEKYMAYRDLQGANAKAEGKEASNG